MTETLQTLLLGVEHATYGEYAVAAHDERSACAISVGSAGLTPARLYKADVDVPNEDAVCAIDEGARTLLAVADSHYGHRASHVLLERLVTEISIVPANILELFDVVVGLADDSHDFEERERGLEGPASGASPLGAEQSMDVSESTLLVGVVDREARRVFGLCYGDSSLLVLGASIPKPGVWHAQRELYVTPREPASLHPVHAVEFDFELPESGLVVAYTDGVNECCYREPALSVQVSDIARVAEETSFEPEPFVSALAVLALTGVRGRPGGQDNLAIAATCVLPDAGKTQALE